MFDFEDIYYPILFLAYLFLVICFVIIIKLKYYNELPVVTQELPLKEEKPYAPKFGEESIKVRVYNDYGGCWYYDIGKRYENLLREMDNQQISLATPQYVIDESNNIQRPDIPSDERQKYKLAGFLYNHHGGIASDQSFDYSVRVHH